MLPVVILDCDADPGRGKAQLQERDVIAATAESIRAPDLAHVETDLQSISEIVEVARNVARGCVIFTTEAVRRGHEVRLTLHTRPLRQDARMRRIANSVRGAAVADNVVVEHCDDIP